MAKILVIADIFLRSGEMLEIHIKMKIIPNSWITFKKNRAGNAMIPDIKKMATDICK